MSIIFCPFFEGSTFCFHIKEWGEPVHYLLLFLKISGPMVAKCCLEFPVFEQILLVLLNILFILIENFTTKIPKIVYLL